MFNRGPLSRQRVGDSRLCRSCRIALDGIQDVAGKSSSSQDGEFFRELVKTFCDLPFWFLFGNGRSISALRNSAKKGCVTCGIFAESLAVQEGFHATRSGHGYCMTTRMLLQGFESVTDVGIRYRLREGDLQEADAYNVTPRISIRERNCKSYVLIFPRLEVENSADHAPDQDQDRNDSPLWSHTRDEDGTWLRARKWLADCKENEKHSICSEAAMDHRIPTRLIFISKDGRSCHLRNTEKLKNRRLIRYLTLTHCWGKRPIPLVATRDNLESLEKNIPYDQLTQTFQDAITASNQLGYRYLWIDSLCILQDDDEDWVTEASRMATVYSGCDLNLVAADAPDGSFGFFFGRDERAQRVAITYQGVNYECAPSNYSYLANTSVMRRGWCFQETMLAPRSLYFCRSQLFWECRELHASEYFPTSGVWNDTPLRASTVRWNSSNVGKDRAQEWMRVVVPYSRTSVSYPKDKLIAFSGIARLFARAKTVRTTGVVSPSTPAYLAGLWRASLIWELLWHVPRDARRPRNEALLAPSWSWASIDGAIKSKLVTSNPFRSTPANAVVRDEVQIVDCSVSPTTSDEFGEVSGGYLTIRCAIPERIKPYFERAHVDIRRKRWGKIWLDHSDQKSSAWFMVPIWRNRSKIFGLIVEPVQDSETYRRIGFYWLKSRPSLNERIYGITQEPVPCTKITIV